MTQLGGVIAGNENMQGGPGARVILNEVTSSNRSHIQGYIEVGGQKADVILANPNGITVNGGGFINTGNATLTTGKPIINGGAYAGVEVRQGDVRVEGAGLNASNTDAFSILSRTAELSADVRANQLNVVTGRNAIDQNGAVTPFTDTVSDTPTVSLDTSALGGMYAGRISLTATEKGVGVNLQGAVQSTGALQISADGKLVLREAAAGGTATVKAEEIDVKESLYSSGNMNLAAKKIETDGGLMASGSNLTVTADTLNLKNARAGSGVDASGHAKSKANTLLEAQTVTLEDTHLVANGEAALVADTVELKSSTVVADGAIVDAVTVSLEQTSIQSSSIAVAGDTVTLAESELSAAGDVVIQADTLTQDASSATIAGNDLTVLSGNLKNNGLYYARGNAAFGIEFTLENADNGNIMADGDILLTGRTPGSRMGRLYNHSAVIESFGGDINIFATAVDNILGPVVVRSRELVSEREYYTYNVTYTGPGFNPDGSYNFAEDIWTVNYSFDDINAILNPLNAKYGTDMRRPGDGRGFQIWIKHYEDYIAEPYLPTSIMAANDLNIDALNVTNDKATLAAGKDVFIQADTLLNTGLDLIKRTNVYWRFLIISLSGQDKGRQAHELNNSNVIDSLPGLVTAADTVFLDVTTFTGLSVKNGEPFLGTSSGQPGTISLDPSGMPNVSGNALPLPGGMGSLFKVNTDPGHLYRIETRSELTSFGTFYGSPYFLSRLGLDLDALHRRLLGDAFYETRLVAEQVLRATGRRVLDGAGSDTEQMLMLMDNAAAQAAGLELTVGMALTPQQIAALTSDIIWLEEREVDGEIVLAPVLYLASVTLEKLDIQRGSQINGQNVIIRADTVKNGGLITGNVVDVAAVDVLNEGGKLNGKQYLAVDASRDIINRSGSLAGGDVVLAAGRDILNITNSRHVAGTSDASYTYLDQVADISSTGNVQMTAGRNIGFTASRLDVDGHADLAAGNDITVTALATDKFRSNRRVKEYTVTNVGSQLGAGSMTMTAGRDVTVAGSGMATEGDMSLNAGRSVSIVSVTDTRDYAFRESGNGRSRKIDKNSETSVGSNVVAGGNLSINAGTTEKGHITAVGSRLGAVGDTTLTASGDIAIASAQDKSTYSEFRSKKKMFSSSMKYQAEGSITQAGSEVFGNNVTIHAGDNVLISASGVTAQNDLTLKADTGDVMVVAGQDQWYSHEESKKTKFHIGNIVTTLFTGGTGSLFGLDGTLWSSVAEKANSSGINSAPSFLSAGNNLTIDAGRDVGIVGSYVQAGNDLSVSV